MITLYATLATLAATFRTRLSGTGTRREDGVVTLEAVFWAAALIILGGIIVAAFTAFVNGKLGDLG